MSKKTQINDNVLVDGKYVIPSDVQNTIDDMYYNYRRKTIRPESLEAFTGRLLTKAVKAAISPRTEITAVEARGVGVKVY